MHLILLQSCILNAAAQNNGLSLVVLAMMSIFTAIRSLEQSIAQSLELV